MPSPLRMPFAALALALCLALAGPNAAYADGAAPASSAAQVGDTPADFPGTSGFADATAPAARVGDTPVDFPGATRAPAVEPPTYITITRPETTVVRDVDEALPIILSGAALFIVLAALAVVAARSHRLHAHPPVH